MEQLFASSKFERLAFAITDKAMTEYAELTHPKRKKRLGNGEAAVMSYVRFHGGTVVSNNLSDVVPYCTKHSIEFISTDDILCIGVTRGCISRADAATMWDDMKNRRQALPSYDFNEAYSRFVSDSPKDGSVPSTG